MFPIFSSFGQFTFLLTMLVLGGAYIKILPSAMDHGFWPAALFALCISAIPMQLVARVLEHRWMLPPSTQFKGFIYGDTFCLPIAVGLLAMLVQRANPDAGFLNWGVWSYIALVIALALATGFRLTEESAYVRPTYESPTKLWHDWFVIFMFSFVLLKYAPALWQAKIGWDGAAIALAAVAAFGAWSYLAIVVDSQAPKPTGAHIHYYWHDALFGAPGTGVNGPSSNIYLRP